MKRIMVGIMGLIVMLVMARWLWAAEEINVDRMVNAIYIAEGGVHAKKPFGVLSVKCEGYEACRSVCRNSVRNNVARWKKAGCPKDFISFMRDRYAPLSDSALNKNWAKNVSYYYNKGV